jgi:hypothetical protein
VRRCAVFGQAKRAIGIKCDKGRKSLSGFPLHGNVAVYVGCRRPYFSKLLKYPLVVRPHGREFAKNHVEQQSL